MEMKKEKYLQIFNYLLEFSRLRKNPVEIRNISNEAKNSSFMMKLIRAELAKLNDAEYYRKSEGLNVVGYYLKLGDEI